MFTTFIIRFTPGNFIVSRLVAVFYGTVNVKRFLKLRKEVGERRRGGATTTIRLEDFLSGRGSFHRKLPSSLPFTPLPLQRTNGCRLIINVRFSARPLFVTEGDYSFFKLFRQEGPPPTPSFHYSSSPPPLSIC